MGAFDFIHCQYILPIGDVSQVEFQAKESALDNYLTHYDISAKGTLTRREYHREPTGTVNSLGWPEFRTTGVTHEPMDYTGSITFYGNTTDDMQASWVEFCAMFRKGELIHIEQIHPEPQEPTQ